MDTHGMKFVVDTSDVAKGFRDYRSAVEGIFTSLDKFEGHVKKTLDNVGRAAGNKRQLNSFKKSLEAFGNVKIDSTAARRLSALSQAMQGFKAPSAAQATNTRVFFKALGGMPDLTQAYRSTKAVNSLKVAMEGFKAPSAAQSKRLKDFALSAQQAAPALRAFSNIRGISGIANELATISIAIKNLKAPSAGQVTNLGNMALALRAFNFSNLKGSGNFYAALGAISNFKAPSAAQIRNLQNFVTAVANMKMPPGNSEKIAASLTRIANAASYANASMGRLRGGLGPLNSSLARTGAQARSASIQMMGLQNAFSGTFQIGSVLRSLLGSLTVAELGRNFLEAANTALAFEAQMGLLSKETGFAANQLDWISKSANRFGVDVLTAQTGFGKVSIAAYKAGLTVGETRHIFEGLSSAMTVLGTKTDRQNDVWLAVQQVMNKGYLSAEELNQQLNEHLPGAMAYAAEYAQKLGMSLEDGLKNKALDADKVLAHIAQRMKDEFGPAVEEALKRPAAQFTILTNNFDLLFQKIGQFGGNEAVANLLKTINESMTPEDIERYAKAWGEALYNGVNKVTQAFIWLRDNWDQIKGPLATGLEIFAKWSLISGTFQIGRFFVAPLIQAGTVIKPLVPLMWDLVYAGRALAASNLSQFYTQLALIGNPRIAQGVSSLSNSLGTLAGTRTGAGLATIGRGVGGIGTAAKAAAPMVARLAGVLTTGLAVAWATGAKAAEDSLGRQVTLNYTATEIMYGMWLNATDGIGKAWDMATDWIDEQLTWLFGQFGINFEGIGTLAAKTAVAISYVFMRMAQGLGHVFASLALSIGNTLSDIGSGVMALFRGDFDTAYAKAQGLLSGQSFKEGFSDGMQGFRFDNADFEQYYAKVGSGFAKSVQFLNWQGMRGRAAMAKPEGPGPNQNYYMQSDEEVEAVFDKLRGEQPDKDKDGKKKGGKKGKSAEQRAKDIMRGAKSLMSMFSEVDPLGDLYANFVDTLHEQSQILLNDKGYKTFISNVKQDAANGKVSVDALVAALKDGGNLSSETMTILRDRYGKNVQDIIDLLVAQQAAYENAVKDATVKAIDFKFQTATDMIQALGDMIPSVSALGEAIDKLTPLAKAALPGDAFAGWLENLRSGADDAISSSEDLAERILDLAGTTPVLDNALKTLNISAEEYAEAIRAAGRATDYAQRMAKRDDTFGGNLLASMDEEIAMLGLRDREGDIMRQLADATKDYIAAGEKNGPLTDEMIGKLELEIRKRQQLADELKRGKEFYENNGVRSYLNDIQSAGQAANELDRNVLQSLEDQLYSLGTTGKFSFTAIFDTIQQGLVRFASQDITRALTEGLFGGRDNLESGTPTIFGKLLGKMGHEYKPAGEKLGTRGMSQMMPLFVQEVGINKLTGELTTGNGTQVGIGGMMTESSVFKPFGAANDNAVSSGVQGTAEQMAQDTTMSFKDSMVGMMPMIGMAFASSFKSPIAQVAVMFGTMIVQKLLMSSMGGAGGGGGGILAGLFSEGGYSGSAVSHAVVPAAAFSNAPHYSQGTANTSGGMPAVLHDNEAVVPLSRGRKIPVEMNDNSGGGRTVVNNWTIQTPNADSFQKSRQQIVTDMHATAQRAYFRNN